MSEKKEVSKESESPFIEIAKNEVAIKEIVLDHSLVLPEAYVNKSAVVKTDIKYLWNKFCQDNGGVENAVRLASKAMQDPSAFADVSSINQHDPLQSMVSNEVRKKEIKGDIDRAVAEQRSKSGKSVEKPVAPAEPTVSNEK